MARKEKTAIKHVGCGGIVLQYRSWGRTVYQCSRCYQKSRDIDFFTIRFMLAKRQQDEADLDQ